MKQSLSLAALAAVVTSQSWHELESGKGSDQLTCFGKSEVDIEEYDIEWDVEFALEDLYEPQGHLVWPSFAAEHTYRVTACGAIINTSCSGKPWSMERVNRTNERQCIEGIARWDEEAYGNGAIEYDVNYFLITGWDEDTQKPIPIGITIQVTDDADDKECPNDKSEVNYNIVCTDPKSNSTYYRAIYEDFDNCLWNVSIHSPHGCVKYYDADHSSSNNNNDNISWGTTFIIIILVVGVVYLVCGVLYNSFMHGRVGKHALPNFDFWARFFDNVRAGFAVTANTLLCRRPGSEDYASVY
jgi:hypothetical protein